LRWGGRDDDLRGADYPVLVPTRDRWVRRHLVQEKDAVQPYLLDSRPRKHKDTRSDTAAKAELFRSVSRGTRTLRRWRRRGRRRHSGSGRPCDLARGRLCHRGRGPWRPGRQRCGRLCRRRPEQDRPEEAEHHAQRDNGRDDIERDLRKPFPPLAGHTNLPPFALTTSPLYHRSGSAASRYCRGDRFSVYST
jgi:hypothetical protein